ncbi:hypothetical protein BLOT_013861 [Blomia tropicalis]|nr:hypothetical protein BLOT_013861 [Blomia tropicalis]
MKILFFAVDAAGHLNACVGLAQALVERGHKVKFLLNESFKGQFGKFGFDEMLLKPAPMPNFEGKEKKTDEPPVNPIKVMAEMLLKSGFLSSKTPLEKMKENKKFGDEFLTRIYDGLVHFNPQIEEIIKNEKPDLLIVDHFIVPPCFPKSGIPWMFLFSGNPLNLYRSTKLPPFGGGFAIDSDPETWTEFRELCEEEFKEKFKNFQNKINKHFDYPVQLDKDSDPYSPYLNIYGYPKELDYQDIVPVPERYISCDAFCLTNPDSFKLPDGFHKPGEKLIYVSLGSMGSVDVELMKRITSVLAKTQHKYIISKGPRADEYELPDNCYGEASLPQTSILPMVDLVITHGGNNTVTETFSNGKPMIVMPLFADQYDNAQRVQEKGYGLRLETYGFTDDELLNSIDKLLNDKEINDRAKAASERIRKTNSKQLVAQKIEQVVAEHKSKQ